jgi:hypothetical protein
MIELRFSRAIYDGAAIDSALHTFDAHARFERSEDDSHFVVSVLAHDPSKERRIAGELGNYALGLTVRTLSTDVAEGST